MSTATGANTIWVYRWEDDQEFNQNPGEITDTENKTFGANVTADAADRSNNPERMWRPFDRAAETILEMQFDGSWGADFVLSNTWWLQFIFGEPEVEGTDAPYTHTYNLDPANPPKSAHLIEETHYPDGTAEQTVYTGCFVPSGDVDVSVEDTVDISLDGEYADEEFYEDATNSPYGEIASQPSIEYRPMHFGNSYLRLDVTNDGSVDLRSLVQDASLTLEGNVEGERELGTRFIAIPSFLQFEPDISYTNLVGLGNKSEEQRASYGSTAATSPQESMHESNDLEGELEFDAGIAEEENSVTFELEGAFPDTYSRNNIGDPQEALEDDIDRMVRDVTAVVQSDMAEPL